MTKTSTATTSKNPQPHGTDTLPPEELAGLAELAKKQAHKVLGKIPLMGSVTWLMMQQSYSRHTLLSELEWRILPALVLDQAKLYMKFDTPVAFASWARFSEAAAQRYRNSPHQLMAADWASGDQVWLIDVFTPFGGAQDVLKDLREKVFAGQIVHQLVPAPNAASKVLAWPALEPKDKPVPEMNTK